MRTVIFIPPLSRMSGGLATLYAVAGELRALGHEVALTCPGGKAAGFAEAGQAAAGTGNAGGAGRGAALSGETASTPAEAGNVREAANAGDAPWPVLPWEGLELRSSDLWLVPESWPNAIGPGVRAGARTLVYAQSWNFLLTTLPEGVSWNRLPVEFLAVSRPVARFLEDVLGVPALGILPPAVDPVFFSAGDEREAAAPQRNMDESGAKPAAPEPNAAGAPGPQALWGGGGPCGRKTIRVAWMPRKNRGLADQIRQVAAARLASLASAPPVEYVPLQNLTPPEVAAGLASCHLFLATAFPEGFGLPPLEAMAAGCVPVGFTGYGGWEYMRQAQILPGAGKNAPDSPQNHAAVPAKKLLPDHAGGKGQMGGDSAPAEAAKPFAPTHGAAFRPALRPVPAAPPFALPDEPSNGLFFADGDVLGAGLGLADAVMAAYENGAAWRAAQNAGRGTALRYTQKARRETLAALWREFS